MSNVINIVSGEYRGKKVENQTFPLIEAYRIGAKGGFVTVNGTEHFGVGREKIKIKLDSEQHFHYVGGNSEHVSAPAEVHVTETDDEAMARIAERFETLTDMSKAAIAGDIKALIVTGPPGIGKSFGVETELEKASLFDQIAGRKIRSTMIKGSTTAIGLYCALFKYSDRGNIIVFDDCDDIFFDSTCLNLLKGVLDTGKTRKVSWLSDSHMLRREGVPDSFNFHGSVIFITNLKFDNVRSKTLKDHLTAIESRCHYIDLKIDSTCDKLLRVKQITRDGMLDEYDFEDGAVEEIVEFVEANVTKLRELSLRTVIKIADLRKAFPTKWESLARTTVMKDI